jgi:hypothetical protein
VLAKENVYRDSGQAYLMLMKKQGRDEVLLRKVRHCLEMTSNETKLHERHQILNTLYRELANGG